MKREDVIKLLEKAYEKYPPRKCVGFKVTKTKTSVFDCKMGGVPYFPKDMEYPVSRSEASKGKPLWLLEQLNFEKIPHIEDFPEKGILQFFVGGSDTCYGMNFKDLTEQSDYRLIYHEDIITDESKLMSKADLPVYDEDEENFMQLPFEPGDEYLLEPADITDAHPTFGDDGGFCDAFMEIYHKEYPAAYEEDPYDIEIDGEDGMTASEVADQLSGNDSYTFIGGYPVFIQCDPREDDIEDAASYDTVLFESISIWGEDDYEDVDIMWGDDGTGTFLISREALKKRDFSKVIYNYDCY